ncbi:hypothetical protein OU789_16620 [Halocynthiibacter sp. C4]|uniref:LamG-like jellyroll fold domain-containing protein n=1 Tax=Halocynthiibacter sp. C4 TaxID=2992758 RepID=UPI00237B3E80|nr:LamG-like jellyroll fold domain-containing protein [Halocynthiibacter sp. C4]MDE0591564.1 hypothetical protein [Halocynthiibacter sp. C4]
MGKPNLAAGRSEFVYSQPIVGLPEASARDLKNKSFSITAKVTIDDNAHGMIFTQGGNTDGWGFYLLDGKLAATQNYLDILRYTATSDDAIAAGEHELKMELAYDGGEGEIGKSGTITLYVDGQQVGTGTVDQTVPMKFSLSENQDIGAPITYDYSEPFDFEGNLGEVFVSLAGS